MRARFFKMLAIRSRQDFVPESFPGKKVAHAGRSDKLLFGRARCALSV